MGLFDSIAGQVAQQATAALSGQGGAGGDKMVQMVMGLLNNPELGGISGLVSAFQKNGLGEVVASWISNNTNLPISAAQIQSVLGQGPLQDLAAKTGLSTNEVAANLSEHLPGLVDQLTPEGKLPSGDMMAQGLGMLKGFMKS
ncbi:YidB family protein [Limnohabitans sp. 2KL-3]|uniref:YidB family protein n=1 Tax=Limnohabitans sp. 2KL-3 TaxID=1100700 RepID=UPI000B0F54E2|nr:YidB family protein [Limnohabitans sp. 2KL-3]